MVCTGEPHPTCDTHSLTKDSHTASADLSDSQLRVAHTDNSCLCAANLPAAVSETMAGWRIYAPEFLCVELALGNEVVVQAHVGPEVHQVVPCGACSHEVLSRGKQSGVRSNTVATEKQHAGNRASCHPCTGSVCQPGRQNKPITLGLSYIPCLPSVGTGSTMTHRAPSGARRPAEPWTLAACPPPPAAAARSPTPLPSAACCCHLSTAAKFHVSCLWCTERDKRGQHCKSMSLSRVKGHATLHGDVHACRTDQAKSQASRVDQGVHDIFKSGCM